MWEIRTIYENSNLTAVDCLPQGSEDKEGQAGLPPFINFGIVLGFLKTVVSVLLFKIFFKNMSNNLVRASSLTGVHTHMEFWLCDSPLISTWMLRKLGAASRWGTRRRQETRLGILDRPEVPVRSGPRGGLASSPPGRCSGRAPPSAGAGHPTPSPFPGLQRRPENLGGVGVAEKGVGKVNLGSGRVEGSGRWSCPGT